MASTTGPPSNAAAMLVVQGPMAIRTQRTPRHIACVTNTSAWLDLQASKATKRSHQICKVAVSDSVQVAKILLA